MIKNPFARKNSQGKAGLPGMTQGGSGSLDSMAGQVSRGAGERNEATVNDTLLERNEVKMDTAPEQVMPEVQTPTQEENESTPTIEDVLPRDVDSGVPSRTQQDDTQVVPPTPTQGTKSSDAFDNLQPQEKVSFLVKLAHTEGLNQAYRMASNTQDAFVIDKFHDTLINQLLEKKQDGQAEMS